MIEGLKPLYNNILRPVMRGFAGLGIHPNVLTVIGLGFFGVSGYFTAIDRWYWALVLIVTGACFDGLDGLLAREMNLKSTFGAILDSTVDRVTEIVWFLGLLGYYLRNGHEHQTIAIIVSFAAMSGSIMVSYVKARCEGAGVSCRPGILQRPERIVLISFFLLLGTRVMFWGVIILAALTWITVVQRIGIAWKNAKSMRTLPE